MNQTTAGGLAAALVLAVTACASPPPTEETAAAPAPAALENGGFTAELDGRSIHYQVHGQGPVLMTVPNSWGLTLDGLRALYRPLEGRLTMVYFDPRGMGGSGPAEEDDDLSLAAVRDDFDALRRHLGLERVNAIGWSNGATNLMLLAAERPEILDSAIILHGIARWSGEDFADFSERFPEWFAASNALREELSGEGMSEEDRTDRFARYQLDEAFPYLFADPDSGRAALAEAWSGVGFSYRHGAYSQTELPEFDGRELLGQVTARCLVIAGAHDLMPPARAEEIHTALADSRFVVFENSGHFAPLEQPDLFADTVVAFLTGG